MAAIVTQLGVSGERSMTLLETVRAVAVKPLAGKLQRHFVAGAARGDHVNPLFLSLNRGTRSLLLNPAGHAAWRS